DQHELFFTRVPQRDGVIAFDLVDEVEAAFFVEMQDCFGVSARGVLVTTLFEIGAEKSMVVDLAIEDEPGVFVTTVHRLMTRGRQVDDGEPAKPKPTAMPIKHQLARIVRPAMHHLIAHACKQRLLDRAFTRPILPNSTNSTHNPRFQSALSAANNHLILRGG